MTEFQKSQKKIDGTTQLSIWKVTLTLAVVALACVVMSLNVIRIFDYDMQMKCEVKRVAGDKHHPFHKVCN